MFAELPAEGAWRLLGAYEGFEVVRFSGYAGGSSSGKNSHPQSLPGGFSIEGTSVGVEGGVAWSIHYAIEIASNWHVRGATVTSHAGDQLAVQTDGLGAWTVNGEPRPELNGCLDLDFEASAVTNTLPIHRLQLAIGARGESAAAYVRINGLVVERLEQSYLRLPDRNGRFAFDYESPRFGYHDTLLFAPDGLVVNYPSIGERVPLQK